MKSGASYKLEIAHEAHDDLISIYNYTISRYGENQAFLYLELIDKAFQLILKEPLIGHVRDDIPRTYKSWIVEKHVVIYRIESNYIYVVRALHGSMDFRFQF